MLTPAIAVGDGLALPQVGDVIDGRYRIDEHHAKGGMGTVYRATHLLLERQVALKVASSVVVGAPGGSERFLREARLATRVVSARVSQVFDVGVLATGMPYLVMEWLDGEDLGAVLKSSGPLPVETAVDYVLQACEALADVHRHGIVHRDLKPGNLFLVHDADGNARIKLIDFGVSKLIGMGQDLSRITLAGTAIGSPPYMSPEQMGLSEISDERTDVWGLGVVLYELLTGELPFRGDTLDDILGAILLRPLVRVSERNVTIPPDLDAAIARCLKVDQADRFPNVGALAAALAPFAPAPPTPRDRRPTPVPPARARGRAMPQRAPSLTAFHTAARVAPSRPVVVRRSWLRGRRGLAFGAFIALVLALPVVLMEAAPASTSTSLPGSVATELLPRPIPPVVPELEDASADAAKATDAARASDD